MSTRQPQLAVLSPCTLCRRSTCLVIVAGVDVDVVACPCCGSVDGRVARDTYCTHVAAAR